MPRPPAPDDPLPDLPEAAPVERPGGLRGRIIARLEARGRYRTWVLWAALSGMFAATFPFTILAVSLKSIADEFGARETTLAWVISAPMLLSAVALPLLGKLGDLYGHRRVFLTGSAAATAVAALTALAWDPLSLIGLRTLAAVLGGATQPTSMAILFGVYPPHERVRAMGWWSMTGAGAPALGLAVGGPLVDLLGWRVVFVLQALFALASVVLAALVLRETERHRVRFDLAGALTLAVGVAGLMFALGQARDLGPASPWVLGAAAAGLLGLVAFVRVERRASEPLLSLEYFAQRTFGAAIVSNALMAAAYMGAFIIAPFVLLGSFGFSVTVAAGIMLLRTASLTAASPFGGALGYRIGERGAAVTGCGVMTAGIFAIAWGTLAHSLPALGAGLVLQGVGHGLALPSLTSAVSNAVPESDLGIASATNRLTSQAGAAFGITALTLVYGGREGAVPLATAFLAGGVLSVLSLGAALLMQRPGAHPLEHVEREAA